MGQGHSLARVAVRELEDDSQHEMRKDPHRTTHPAPVDPTGYYGAALLKLALELRRPEPGALDEVIARILDGIPVDREAFRGYVLRNFSLLRRT